MRRGWIVGFLLSFLLVGFAHAASIQYISYGVVGGMNSTQPLSRLGEGQCSLLQNVEFNEKQLWSLRKGYEAICNTLSGTPKILEIVNYAQWDGTDYLCVFTADSLFTATSYSNDFTAYACEQKGSFDFEVFNNLLVIARQDSTLLKFDGTTVDTLEGSPPSEIRCIRAFKNYVFVISSADTTSSRLFISGLGDVESWDTDVVIGDWIDVNKGDGSWLTGLAVWGNKLVLFKRHTTHILAGYSPDTFEIMPLFQRLGCKNHETIREIKDGVIWQADETRFFKMTSNGLDEISWPIRSLLESYNADFLSRSMYHPTSEQYQVTFDSDSNDTADVVLTFDVIEEKWSKYTGMNFASLGITSIDGAEFPRKPVGGGYDGNVYQLDYGTDDADSSIAFEIDTQEFDVGIPFATKGFRYVYVWMEADSTTIVPTLDYWIDGVEIETGKTLTPDLAGRLDRRRVNLRRSGRVIQFKIKHTGVHGGQLHIGGFTIGYVVEGGW